VSEGERDIDPAAFRAQAFTEFWDAIVSPQARYMVFARLLERHGDLFRPRQAYVRSLPLSNILMVEGNRWLDLGAEIGYFASTPKRLSRPLPPDAEDFFSLAPAAEDPFEFGAEIAYAQETLSPSHLQMLELLHFSEEEEWGSHLEQLRTFAQALDRQPRWRPAPEWLEAIQWALGDEQTEEQVNPAFWRLGGLGRYGFGSPLERVQERVRALGQLRARIAGAVELSVNLEAAAEESPVPPGLFWPASRTSENPEGSSGR
jgi:hypothetical protein